MTARAGARSCALLSALAASVVASAARAAPTTVASPVDLTWNAPAGCPTAVDVSRELERLVRVPSARTLPYLTVDGRVEPRGERWLLHLRTVRDGVEGERELEAESCASLARAATLVVALALGVGSDQGESAAAPPPPEEPRARPAPRARVADAPPPPPVAPAPPAAPLAPSPSLAVPVAVVVAPPPAPRAPFTWRVSVDGRAARGPLPGASFGGDLGVDGVRGRLMASLRLETWIPEDEATAAPGVRARFSGVGGELAGCAIPARAGRFALATCAGARAGALHGASSGALADGAATAPWYAVVPALRTRTRVARALFVDAGVELAASLNRPRFVIGNLGDIYTVPRLVPAAMLGLSVDL
jgi:hypothetical protein